MFLSATLKAAISLGAVIFCASVASARHQPPIERLTIRDNVYGTRNVSYFRTIDGLAIIDGDIVYGTVENLLSKDIRRWNPNDQSHSLSKRAFSGLRSVAWPNGVVRYQFDSDEGENQMKDIVDGAIARWLESAPYLTFKQVLPNGPITALGVLSVRVAVCGDCGATLGYSEQETQMMVLEPSCPSSPLSHCNVSDVTHELGHVLGLLHEHQRPDRPQYVNFLCENVDPVCSPGVSMPAGKTCCDIDDTPDGCCYLMDGNLNLITGDDVDWSGTYDTTSLMHYRANAGALPGTKIFTPAAPGVVVATTNPSYPSRQDYDRVCKLYETICPKALKCRAAGCPATCKIVDECKVPACFGPNPPACCDAKKQNQACYNQQRKCRTSEWSHCEFLRDRK